MSNRDPETSNFLTNMRKASILSSLWVFVLLSMLFRDVHEIPKKEFIEDALNRTVPDELFLFAGNILAMPILMAPLSKLLPGVWSRRVNLVVVIIITVGIIANPPGDLDDYWFAALQLSGLAATAWTAWRWRSAEEQPAAE